MVVGASEHNLQNVSITLPRDTLTVFTGVSGSGKSSLAFDTLFKEGQRRFLESLSPYARQFLGQMEKPRVEHVEGLSPTISIDQKTVNRNPRSTVGTITELYDHYRLLMARLGQPYCPNCDIPIATLTPEQIADRILAQFQIEASRDAPQPSACMVFAPMVRERKGEYRKELAQWLEQGYLRCRIDGEIRRLDEEIVLGRYEKHTLELVLDRFTLTPANRSRLTEAVEKAVEMAGGLVSVEVAHPKGDEDTKGRTKSAKSVKADTVESMRANETALETESGGTMLFSSHMACPSCQLPIPELEPRLFSFNDPQGACPTCNGLGSLRRFSEAKLTHPRNSLDQGAFTCFTERGNLVFTDMDGAFIQALATALEIDTKTPWQDLPEAHRQLLLEGNHGATLRVKNIFRNPGLLLDEAKQKGRWPGLYAVLGFIEKFVGGALEKYQSVEECPGCGGKRLNPVALAVRFRTHGIHTLVGMTIEESVEFYGGLTLNPVETIIGKDIFREINTRLRFLNDVGVGYLTMERRATTLSGGEAQRIRLASQVGSGLQGVLYVLDEPSIGLHQTDNRKLIQTLTRLRDVGNTVYVVEHDEETITAADHVVDLGPGAGSEGGAVLAQGSLSDLLASPTSLSGQYLAGKLRIKVPKKRRKPGRPAIKVTGASRNNLRDINVTLPLGVFLAVTGVSGSGKSTLVHDILRPCLMRHLGPGRSREEREKGVLLGGKNGDFKRISGMQHLDKMIEIDQSPIGRTPRSNPATYTKVLDQIRGLFAGVPEARIRGYKPGRFSFNVRGGRCEVCEGAGIRTIEMQFLSNVEVVCEECGGRRFNEETLQIHYKAKTIADVLEMSVEEAATFFTNIPAAARILETLRSVGLGYIKLGQPSTTLSGGEAQRVKLASELRKKSTGRTLYLLDEPTTGLHFHDIQNLLECLNTLVEQGNTVLVIEHNLDVIKVADQVIDLGPGGGKYGGKLVAHGTPEELAANSESLTGKVLVEALNPTPINTNGKRAVSRPARRDLVVRGAEQNNLKHLDITLPRNRMTVITGVSGSGKTSLAFDTLFAEGQARYVESLSTYARRFLGRMDKARVESIDGLAPAIAIDQKNSGRSPRSTVATVTEMYDYLRLLYARIGKPHCPHCGSPLAGHTPTQLARLLAKHRVGARVVLLAPLYRPNSSRLSMLDDLAHLPQLAQALVAEGFTRMHLNGEVVELHDWLALPAGKQKVKRGTAVDLVMDRVKVNAKDTKRLAEAMEAGFEKGHGLIKLHYPDGLPDDAEPLLSGAATQRTAAETLPMEAEENKPRGKKKASASLAEIQEELLSEPVGCVACDYYQDDPLTPRMFSFNSHVGACPECSGLGKTPQVDPALLAPFDEHPLLEGALMTGRVGQSLARKHSRPYGMIHAFAKREGIPLEKPWGKLKEAQRQALLFGDNQRLSFSKRRAYSRTMRVMSTTFRGVVGIVMDWYLGENREKWTPLIEPVMANVACRVCDGERLKPAYRAVTLSGASISQFCANTVESALGEIDRWTLNRIERQVAEQPLQEIRSRLTFLKDVGLGYLTLGREAVTLSGGEAQRIRLASQLGSHLVGVLYVLDEPTIGLHSRDTARLLGTLKRLRDLGNTVVVVEHDPETIAEADHVLDMGPGAGYLGGEVVAAGSPAEIAANPASLTGAYLSGRLSIPRPEKSRMQPLANGPKRGKGTRGKEDSGIPGMTVKGARANNLKNIDVVFPLGVFTAVTGVSGSGKSSLVVSVLQAALERQLEGKRVVPGAHDALTGLDTVGKLVVVDQSPIGKSPKSNPATYSGMLDKIRTLMTRIPESRRRGYGPGRFSFNVRGGRCEACEGRGYNHIEMHFLADVWVPCDVCGGKRYNRETLQVAFRGKNMAEILDLEIDRALELFANQRGIARPLQTLADVGLGYMKLGQAANTLSGGEAQRLKLARELSRPGQGNTVYILDEPTTGLHLDDIAKLIRVLQRLVDEGNTVIVIEHNLDVIKTADHVIDLGPEGGDAGGEVMAVGTPEAVAANRKSHTGVALKKHYAARGMLR